MLPWAKYGIQLPHKKGQPSDIARDIFAVFRRNYTMKTISRNLAEVLFEGPADWLLLAPFWSSLLHIAED